MVKKEIAAILILATVAFFASKESLNKNEIIKEVSHERDSLKNVLTNNQVKLDTTNKQYATSKFDHVYHRFKYYNSDISVRTIKKFIEVTNTFKLDTTKTLFDICISQICVESRARQFNNSGLVIESVGNAVGISQIVPTTAHHYLRNVITNADKKTLYDLGVSDFSFVNSSKRYSMTNDDRTKIIEWLSNENNNIALWGYIMNHNLHKCGYNIQNTLLAYNQGNEYLRKYISSGHNVKSHQYIKMIDKSIRLLKNV